jgi:hypothetical protein
LSAIKRFFLRAKPWHLFCLLFVLPSAAELVISMNFYAAVDMGMDETQFDSGRLTLYLGLTVFFSTLCFVTWLWSMGSFLSSIVPPELKMDGRFFIFALIYQPLFVLALIVVPSLHQEHSIYLIPFQMVALYCGLYQPYFVVKNLLMAEKGKAPSVSDYVAPYLQIVIFFIGIWIIQPRINTLYRKNVLAETFAQANSTF